METDPFPILATQSQRMRETGELKGGLSAQREEHREAPVSIPARTLPMAHPHRDLTDSIYLKPGLPLSVG